MIGGNFWGKSMQDNGAIGVIAVMGSIGGILGFNPKVTIEKDVRF